MAHRRLDRHAAARIRVGQVIRARRKRAGLTLIELSARTGLSPNYLGSVELGQRDVSLSSLGRIAAGLGLSLPELFGEAPRPLSPNGRELAERYMDLSPEFQLALSTLLRVAAKR
jgi:transcriptional regulator with XRE-family HTH domain